MRSINIITTITEMKDGVAVVATGSAHLTPQTRLLLQRRMVELITVRITTITQIPPLPQIFTSLAPMDLSWVSIDSHIRSTPLVMTTIKPSN